MMAAARDARIVHVSALGADLASDSLYARAKAEGEVALHKARPDAVVFRPSVLFGPGDGLFNRFAGLARTLPVLPLAGADTRFQPVYAGDVAEAVARAVDGAVPGAGAARSRRGAPVASAHHLRSPKGRQRGTLRITFRQASFPAESS